MAFYDSAERRRHVLFSSMIYLFLILLLAQFLFLRGINSLKPIYLINIGIDCLGILMGFTLFVCCYIDLQKTGTNVRYLIALINVTTLALFSDGCAWLVDSIPSLRVLNVLDNTIFYLCTPVEAYFFWMYTMSYLKVRKSLVKQLSIIVRAGLYVAIGLRMLNLFTGIYFTVDAQGVYARSSHNWVSLLYAFFTAISALVAVVLERKQLERYQIVTFFMYALAPVAAGIITIFAYGLSIGAAVIMLVILLMYCVLNVSEGREKAAADRDMSLAAIIQENILPKDFPYLPERTEFDLYATMHPAKEVGGDFYDFFMVDDDHLALVMADVSGKGIPAALFMMVSKSLIKSDILNGLSPSQALFDVNNQLCEGNKAELFVTVWLAIIDVRTGEGVSANAGHEHPVIRGSSGKYELIKYKHSPAVAAMENTRFTERAFKLKPGESIFVYTDGVPEANNDENELLGDERMLAALNKEPDAEPKQVLDNMMKDLKEFMGDAKQFDDITMLCMHYNGCD